MNNLFSALAIISLVLCQQAEAKFIDGIAGEIVNLRGSKTVMKVDGNFTPNNEVRTGVKATPNMNAGNGNDYELIGVYGGPTVSGLGNPAHRDTIGVQGTVFKNSADANAIGVRCSVYDFMPGGTSTCLAIDYPYPQAGTPTAGITLLGSSWASGLLGIEIVNPESYKHSINLNGSRMAVGSTDGTAYCLQFNKDTAKLDYIKHCGTERQEVIGQVSIEKLLTRGKR
jgi:hypothetical protein